MPVIRQDSGRVAQKQRTRQALLDAAAKLLHEGRSPTVAEAAAEAGVSRATAYRYFPAQELLLAPAAVLAGRSRLADAELLDTGAITDPAERAGLVARRLAGAILDDPASFRTALRLSLDPHLDYQRPGYRRRWIADLLAPLEEAVDEQTLRRLAGALGILLGSEAVVALTDVTGLDREQVLDVLGWTATTLVAAAITGPPAPGAREEPGRRARATADTYPAPWGISGPDAPEIGSGR